jgi:uncharacterized protein with NAD-binding domain and iron-sulfur cluster
LPKKVVILGGGVAGLSAAHELVERGFQVEIYEELRIPGGKARSLPVYPGVRGEQRVFDLSLERWFQSEKPSLDPGAKRDWLPGEHGFRFFPGFYRHVVDTMARIPYVEGTVADNLVPTTAVLLARFDRDGIVLPARCPREPKDFANLLDAFFKVISGDVGVPLDETGLFASKVWQIMTSCDERRQGEYEKVGWWEFIRAAEQSKAYQDFFGHGITRSLVAAQAQRASAFTIGNTFLQLLFDIADPTVPTSDRLLNGPTNLVWIQPWLSYLRARGVAYNFATPVKAITCSGGRIESVTIIREGHPRTVKGDFYIAALPIEDIAPLITPALTIADPGLANLATLAKQVEWMNGIQFYLKRRVPLVHGHVIYVDSPWALTSVSQTQFWPDFDVSKFGNGAVRDILSIDISDWNAKGLNGKTVKECTRDEAARETWAQIKRSVNVNGREVLKDEDWDHWFIDPDISQSTDDRRVAVNTEPLLVNHKDSLRLRPDAVTKISNFFLASDYVRTHTDLATMEGANEAARRAVNGILEAAGSSAERCQIWPLHEPEVLEPFKTYDREFRWKQGLPYDNRLITGPLWVLELLRNVGGLIPEHAVGPFVTREAAKSPLTSLAGHVDSPFGVDKIVEHTKQLLSTVRDQLSGGTTGEPQDSTAGRAGAASSPSAADATSSSTASWPSAAVEPRRRRQLRIVQK